MRWIFISFKTTWFMLCHAAISSSLASLFTAILRHGYMPECFVYLFPSQRAVRILLYLSTIVLLPFLQHWTKHLNVESFPFQIIFKYLGFSLFSRRTCLPPFILELLRMSFLAICTKVLLSLPGSLMLLKAFDLLSREILFGQNLPALPQNQISGTGSSG